MELNKKRYEKIKIKTTYKGFLDFQAESVE